MKTKLPSFTRTTTLVARALGITPDELRDSFQAATLDHLPGVIRLRNKVRSAPWDDASYLRWRYDFEGRPEARARLMIVARGDRVLGMVGANPNFLGLITRLFHLLPTRKQYISPLRLRRSLAKRFRTGMGALAAPVLAWAADLGLSLWRAAPFCRIPSSWSLRELTAFDDSVEDLFARRWGPEDIAVQRSSQYLNWRLFQNPRARYSVIAAFEGDDMVGYAAWQVRADADDPKVVRLVDWLIDARHGFAGFSLLAQEIMRRALTEGADLLSTGPLHSRLERSLWRLGFLARPGSEFATTGVHCAEPPPWPELYDGSAWFLTQANSDLD